MIRDALLALGLVLSTASQLRPGDLPVGPGELCLVVWIALMLGDTRNLLQSPLTPALTRMLMFWGLFTIALCLGSMTAYALNDLHDSVLFIHDALAYPLLIAVSLLSAVAPDAGCRIERAAWALVLFSIGFFVLQIACGLGVISLPPFDPWYWDRLRGFSQNPNQLAIFCAVVTFLSLHLAEQAEDTRRKLAAGACSLLAMYVGRLTRSDTFGLILVTGFILYALLKLRAWWPSSGRRPTLRTATAVITVAALPVVVVASLLFADQIKAEAEGIVQKMAKGNSAETSETANIRLQSWRHAFDRGIESGLLGLGPGPHLQIPPILVAARRETVDPPYIEHPQFNGTPNFEAHDTFLDLFTQGGLLAVLAYGWLLGTTCWQAYRSRQDGLTVMMWSITVLSIFHLIVRHPLFWFAMVFGLVASTNAYVPSPGMIRSK